MTPNREPWYRCPRPLYATGSLARPPSRDDDDDLDSGIKETFDDDLGLSPLDARVRTPASPPSSVLTYLEV